MHIFKKKSQNFNQSIRWNCNAEFSNLVTKIELLKIGFWIISVNQTIILINILKIWLRTSRENHPVLS